MINRSKKPKIGFFVTCLVDAMRPNIGFASIELLKRAGCEVDVPAQQTCCGQPAFNTGDDKTTKQIAKQVIEAFEPYDYVVLPSGSCASTIKTHYKELFVDDPDWRDRQSALSAKTYEIISFLQDVMRFQIENIKYDGRATYHDSCSGLRQLGIYDQPRALLKQVKGLDLVPLKGSEECCGFGGTFCVKYPEISNAIVDEKTNKITQSGADTLLGGDMGCLMNMAGKLSRQGSDIKVFHIVEVLAGMADCAPICGDEPE